MYPPEHRLPEHRPEISKERAVQWAANASAISLAMSSLIFGFGKNPEAQTALLIGAFPLSLVGAWAGWVADHRLPYLAMRNQVGVENYAEQLASLPAAPATLPPVSQMQYFNWNIINQLPHKWPHLAICGGTGDGKSTLAQSLIRFLNESAIAIDPHYEPGNYPEMPCIAKGRNYGSYPGENIGFKNLIQGEREVSYSDAISTILAEMDRRYRSLKNGERRFQTVSFILDEFNTFISEAGKEASQDVLKIIREARKVGIRLILLLQSDLLKDLGWEGQGAARKSLRWIRLGEFAANYAKSFLKDDELLNWVQTQKHPILVESQPALLPTEVPINFTTFKRQELEQIYHNSPDSPASEPDSPASEPDSPASEPDSPASEPGSNQSGQGSQHLGSPGGEFKEWCKSAKNEAPIRDLSWEEAVNKITIMTLKGWSQRAIVETLWGFKKGTYLAWDNSVKEFKAIIEQII